MEPSYTKLIWSLSSLIQHELPHRSTTLRTLYQKAQEGSSSVEQAIRLSKQIFKSYDFFYHPESRRAYYQFCSACGDEGSLDKLIQCNRNEEIRNFHFGVPLSLDVDKALQYLKFAHKDQAPDLLRYCSDWLIMCLAYDINNHSGTPSTVHIGYYKQIYDDVVRCMPTMNEERVFDILTIAQECGCVEPRYGFSLITVPSLELAAISWFATRRDLTIETLQRYLKWAYKAENEYLMCVSLDLFSKTHRSILEIEKMYTFSTVECPIQMLQLLCMKMASKFDISTAPPELSRGAAIIRSEGGGLKLNDHFIWDMVPDKIDKLLKGKTLFGRVKYGLVYQPTTSLINPFEARELTMPNRAIRDLPKVLEILPSSSLNEITIEGDLQFHEDSIHALLAMTKLSNLKRLTLQLSAHSVTIFFCAVMKKYPLECLNVTLPAKEKSVITLCQALSCHPTLHFVTLAISSSESPVELGSEGLKSVTDLLRFNKKIRRLRIKDIDFSLEQKVLILEALEKNPSVTLLEGFRKGNFDSEELQERMNRYHSRVI